LALSGIQRNAEYVRKGAQVRDSEGTELDQSKVVTSLKARTHYIFPGVLESVQQEEKLVLEGAASVYLQRMSVTWSSPLSDYNRVIASN